MDTNTVNTLGIGGEEGIDTGGMGFGSGGEEGDAVASDNGAQAQGEGQGNAPSTPPQSDPNAAQQGQQPSTPQIDPAIQAQLDNYSKELESLNAVKAIQDAYGGQEGLQAQIERVEQLASPDANIETLIGTVGAEKASDFLWQGIDNILQSNPAAIAQDKAILDAVLSHNPQLQAIKQLMDAGFDPQKYMDENYHNFLDPNDPNHQRLMALEKEKKERAARDAQESQMAKIRAKQAEDQFNQSYLQDNVYKHINSQLDALNWGTEFDFLKKDITSAIGNQITEPEFARHAQSVVNAAKANYAAKVLAHQAVPLHQQEAHNARVKQAQAHAAAQTTIMKNYLGQMLKTKLEAYSKHVKAWSNGVVTNYDNVKNKNVLTPAGSAKGVVDNRTLPNANGRPNGGGYSAEDVVAELIAKGQLRDYAGR